MMTDLGKDSISEQRDYWHGQSEAQREARQAEEKKLQAKIKKFKAQLTTAEGEVERLRGICLRESMVLQEALKRPKNNKSMIAVVAASLAEQAPKGE